VGDLPFELRVLGPVELVDARGRPVDLGGPKERAVITLLALNATTPVSSVRLVRGLWGDGAPRTAPSRARRTRET